MLGKHAEYLGRSPSVGRRGFCLFLYLRHGLIYFLLCHSIKVKVFVFPWWEIAYACVSTFKSSYIRLVEASIFFFASFVRCLDHFKLLQSPIN